MAHLQTTPYRQLKRILDLLLSCSIVLVSIPILVLIAILVKLSSPGPVLFRQERLGLNGKIFTAFKFRTMIVHSTASLADKVTHKSDQRITRIGRMLRDFRLDELPQLLNVIRGEMSVVGPRPLTPDCYPLYSEKDRRRLDVLPGITGWQQVNGGAEHTWTERIDWDIWYVDNGTLLLDIKIMWRTIPVMLFRKGVYSSDGTQLSGVPESLLASVTTSSDENSGNRSTS
jgi:lipopolysaccharide/colanic/teichoic acid biosynthesis glycosyltransferase